jgi:membrane protein required for beta-lactamase induction
MKILNYPVAWMMVISLAIASDFERIFKKCKAYMKSDNIKSMDDTFLYEAADFAVENCEVEAGSDTSIEVVTISVLKRMLFVWLVFVSILVILAV